jgi:type IV pilus assembly protein PilW
MKPVSAHQRSQARRLQYGLSMIEVMIALTLGLVAVGGATAIFLSNRQSFAVVESVARLEENVRFAVDLLSRDIREAGNSVCGGALIRTDVVTATNTWATWERGLVGDVLNSSPVAGLTLARPTGDTAQITGTGSLLVWSGSAAGTPVQFTAHNPTAKTFTTSGASGYKRADVLVACDGSQLLTFEAAIDASGDTVTYTDGTPPSSPQLNAGGYLNPLTAHIWYIGKSTTQADKKALRRLTIDKSGSWGNNNDEMVTGVSGLQIRYLLTNAAGVPTATQYLDSTAVGTQWPLVSAVRLTLTFETSDSAGSTGSAATAITYEVPVTVNIKVRVP